MCQLVGNKAVIEKGRVLPETCNTGRLTKLKKVPKIMLILSGVSLSDAARELSACVGSTAVRGSACSPLLSVNTVMSENCFCMHAAYGLVWFGKR